MFDAATSPEFVQADNAWAGSYVWGPFGKRVENGTVEGGHWIIDMAKVMASSRTTLVLGEQDEWWNEWGWNKGQGAIIGGLAALDTENEWHYVDGQLYFKPPDGTLPDTLDIEAKNRNL